jgi:hypothetical protein
MPRRRYNSSKHKRRFNGVKVFLIVLAVILLASVVAAYANVAPFVNAKEAVLGFLNQWQKQNISSQFDTELMKIGFTPNTALFSQDILSIPGDELLFEVDVIPKDTFTGEPFRTVKLGNEDIGYETLVQSTPPVWLAIISKDGYFFNAEGPLTWTPQELQLPDPSERDYNKIQSMRELRVKHIKIYVPSSDKAAVTLLQDSNSLAEELMREQWKWLISGDWLLGGDLPEEADLEYIRGEFETVFNRHFKLMIVDSDGLQKLKYPD